MMATVRFRGLRPGSAGPDPDPISYLDIQQQASYLGIFGQLATTSIDATQQLSDIISQEPTSTLGPIQTAWYQKVLNHESTSALIFTTEATCAGGQQLYSRIEEVFYVDAAILLSGSVTLQQGPPIEGSETVLVNGNEQTRGITEDYTIVDSTIVFNPGWVLELDDKITVKYLKVV